ncbi:hypothetical protein, partial [Sinomicrobium soli]|uniref:hypothetical protein n=1 Tax=Sinomicrobium sp. N-1-3-6 TaxID=2219864 RepID=UPI000DCE112C
DPGGDEYCWDDIIGQDCYEECDWIDGPIDPNPDPCDDPGNWDECYGDGGDDFPGNGSFEFNLDLVYYDEGDKPLYEYNDKCTGITSLWQLSEDSGNEFAAVLTNDGAILIIQEVNSNGGGINGIYQYAGNTYYQYPMSQGSPSRTYAGQIQSARRYFIPIKATIHSHTPCINDGSDGITNNIINDDKNFASHYSAINHYIIGCSAIGQYNGSSNQAFNIQHGNLSTLCNNVN